MRPWHHAPVTDGPLLVFGPRSLEYDFGPGHPLTPRRFGPGLDLLEAVGARPGLAPEPASDAEIIRLHDAGYVAAVRAFSEDPDRTPGWGIGPGDTPVFRAMHAASAAVVGGSLRAMDAILHGATEHAFHPGGGLHHAMRARASGFCVYDDPALAVARARDAGLRVLYVDLDVHHGDGVESLHADDPGVMTVSIHESGRTLFPGTGFLRDIGSGAAAGTCVNVPLEAGTSGPGWLEAVRTIAPVAAAAFGPDVVVSQHGADSHAWDPLAHLRVTVDAMGAAARMVDGIAHRHASGRWLATGGGGYDAYRVVPRSWALVWLAGAHREPPGALPEAWRARWAAEAARHRQAPLPTTFADDPGMRDERDAASAVAARRIALRARASAVPALLTEAVDRGWWEPAGAAAGPGATAGAAGPERTGPSPEPGVVRLDAAIVDRLAVAPRTIAPGDPADALAIVAAAVRAGGIAVAAVSGDVIVGLALSIPGRPAGSALLDGIDGLIPASAGGAHRVVATGVAPSWRGGGLGRRLLLALAERADAGRIALWASFGPGERDIVDPLPLETRRTIAAGLLAAAGFRPATVPDALDPRTVAGVRPPA
jgi:acetoin utilization protein AcuC